jgi:hypothetical protein
MTQDLIRATTTTRNIRQKLMAISVRVAEAADIRRLWIACASLRHVEAEELIGP